MKPVLLRIFIYAICSFFINGSVKAQMLVPYRQGNKWGYVDTALKIIIKPVFDSAGFFLPGMDAAIVMNRDHSVQKFGLINKAGKQLLATEFDSIYPAENGATLLFFKNGLSGMVHFNSDGSYIVYKPQFSKTFFIAEQFAIVRTAHGRLAVYDFYNQLPVENRYFIRADCRLNDERAFLPPVESSFTFTDSLFHNYSLEKQRREGGHNEYSFSILQDDIKTDGIEIMAVAPVEDNSYKTNVEEKQTTGASIIFKNGKYGFGIAWSDKPDISIVYDSLIQKQGSNFFYAKKTGRWGVIDQKENLLVDFLYKDIFLFPGYPYNSKEFFWARSNEGWLLRNNTKMIGQSRFESVSFFTGSGFSFFALKQRGKIVVLNTSAISDDTAFYKFTDYNSISFFGNDHARILVKNGDRTGLVDMYLFPIVPCKYDSISVYLSNFKFTNTDYYAPLYHVKLNHLHGLYFQKAGEIVPPEYDSVAVLRKQDQILFRQVRKNKISYRLGLMSGLSAASFELFSGVFPASSKEKFYILKNVQYGKDVTEGYNIYDEGGARIMLNNYDSIVPVDSLYKLITTWEYDPYKGVYKKKTIEFSGFAFVKLLKQGKWGLSSTFNFQWLSAPLYDSIEPVHQLASIQVLGIASVKGKKGVVNRDKVIIPFSFDNIQACYREYGLGDDQVYIVTEAQGSSLAIAGSSGFRIRPGVYHHISNVPVIVMDKPWGYFFQVTDPSGKAGFIDLNGRAYFTQ